MRIRFVLCIALIAATAAFGDDVPPPNYTPAAAKPLDALLKAKLAWLKTKIQKEQKLVDDLKRKIKDPEYDTASHKKALDDAEQPLKADKEEEAQLSEDDAIDPSKNSDAGKHAKLIRKNVKAWIETLRKIQQSELLDSVNKEKSAEQQKRAAADARAHGASADALEKDLEKAEKDTPPLFR